jgi:hypothetical protein
MTTPIEMFNGDHWMTFAFLEHCIVDNGGYFKTDRGLSLPTDGRNLSDFIVCGLAIQNDNNAAYQLTDKGWRIAGKLRRHLSDGRSYETFVWHDDGLELLMAEMQVRYNQFKEAEAEATENPTVGNKAILTMASQDYIVSQMIYAKRTMDVHTGEWQKKCEKHAK